MSDNKTNFTSATHLTEKMLDIYNKEKKNNQPYESPVVYKQKPSQSHLRYFCTKCGKSYKIKKNLEEHLLARIPCNIVYDDNFLFSEAMKNLANSYEHLYAIYYNPDVPISEREKVRETTLRMAQNCFKMGKNTKQEDDVLKCIKLLEKNSLSGNFDDDSIENITI